MLKALVVVVPVVLSIYCLIQVAQSRSDLVRTLPRWGWAVLVALVPILGALAWLLIGRPKGPSGTRPVRKKVIAPDDDPDFLRRIRPDRPDEQL